MCEMKENRSSRWDETENWQLERNSVALCAAGSATAFPTSRRHVF